jgi:hypothetical protein
MHLNQLTRLAAFLVACLLALGALSVAIVPRSAEAKVSPKSSQKGPKKKEVTSVFKGMQPMQVRIVRNAQSGCEPDCAEWISAEGDIVDTTPAAFRKVLTELGKRRLPLFINSGGGSIEAAMTIGAMLRERKMDVSVTRTEFEPCIGSAKDCAKTSKVARKGKPNSYNAYCASACTLVLAAGTKRLSSTASHVGVHQIIVYQTQIRIRRTYRVTTMQRPDGATRTRKTLIKEQRMPGKTFEVNVDERTYKPIEAYLRRMGIDSSLVPLMEATPHTGIHWMTSRELASTQLVTEELGGDVLLQLVGRVEASDAPAADTGTVVGNALSVPMFLQGREILADLEVSRPQLEPKIDVRLTLHRGSEALPSRALYATLALKSGTSVRLENSDVVDPFGPLAASSAASSWCSLRGDVKMQLALHPTSGASEKSDTKPVAVSVAAVPGLSALIADLCPATSAASN